MAAVAIAGWMACGAVAPIAPQGDAAAVDAYDAAVGTAVLAVLAACGGARELGVDYRIGVDRDGGAVVVAERVTAAPAAPVAACVVARLAEVELAPPPPRIRGMTFRAAIVVRRGRRIETRSRFEGAADAAE